MSVSVRVSFAPVASWAPATELPVRVVFIADIQARVARFYDLPLIEMRSARRARKVAWPRQVAMYLARRLTTRSMPEIGRRFGGRDHTTVIHAVRAVEARRAADADLDCQIRMLEREFLG
jgi:chromosomal replication initiator protein